MLRPVASWGDRIPHDGITMPRGKECQAPRDGGGKISSTSQQGGIESRRGKSPALSLGGLSRYRRGGHRGVHRIDLRPRLGGKLDRNGFRDRGAEIACLAAVAPVVHVQKLGRKKRLERHAARLVPVAHQGEAAEEVDVLLARDIRN